MRIICPLFYHSYVIMQAENNIIERFHLFLLFNILIILFFDCDCFDFNLHILWKSCNLHTRTCRTVFLKERCIYFIHCRKIIHIFNKYRRLYHMLRIAACLIQQRNQVSDCLLRLCLNIACLKLARFWNEYLLCGVAPSHSFGGMSSAHPEYVLRTYAPPINVI